MRTSRLPPRCNPLLNRTSGPNKAAFRRAAILKAARRGHIGDAGGGGRNRERNEQQGGGPYRGGATHHGNVPHHGGMQPHGSAPLACAPSLMPTKGRIPWGNPPESATAPDPLDVEQQVHHEKIHLPEAFAALGVESSLLHALADIHFTKPSEIQEKMIPVALAGADVLGQARTGTGKTAAFGLPILQRMDLAQPFQAIVVVPTRELAVQVEAELRRLARHKPVRFALAYGGTKVQGNLKQLGHQPHFIVGTPGRIMDLEERGADPGQHALRGVR